jgi:glycosyltransferase involved in cell wall biosynthesis
MKVVHLTTRLSDRGGGIPEVVRQLRSYQAACGQIEPYIVGIQEEQSAELPAGPASRWTRQLPCWGPLSFGFAPLTIGQLLALDPDIVHVHGLWSFMSIVAFCWRRKTGRPYVISPHGMLDPWALSQAKWKKQLASWLYERRCLGQAGCLHALNDAEARAFRRFGLSAPICIIPNGVDPPHPAEPWAVPAWRRCVPSDSKILLFLGRIHPKKGLRELIAAWLGAKVHPKAGDWHLVIAGRSESDEYMRELRSLSRRGGPDGVHFIGPQLGTEKTASFRAAHAFILPSYSEGMPMAVLEAWAHGLPVLMTSACNLPEGFAVGAALEIEASVQGVEAGLHRLFAMSATHRQAMANAASNLVRDRFAWRTTAALFSEVYAWLECCEQKLPAHVHSSDHAAKEAARCDRPP